MADYSSNFTGVEIDGRIEAASVSAAEHGAAGGVNDTEALKAAFVASGVNGLVRLTPGKTYTVDANIGSSVLAGMTLFAYGAILKRADKAETTLSASLAAGTGIRTVNVTDASVFRVGQEVSFYKTTWATGNETTTAETGAYEVTARDAGANTISISGPTIANSYSINDFVVSSCRLFSSAMAGVKVIGLETDGNNASYAGTFFHWVNHVEIRLDGHASKQIECISRDAMKEAFLLSGDGSKNLGCEVYNAGGNAVHMSASNGLAVSNLHVEGTHVTAGSDHQDGVLTYSVDVVNSRCSDIYVDGKLTSVALIGGNNETTINARLSDAYMKNILPGSDGVQLEGTYAADVDGIILKSVHLDNCGNMIIASNNVAQQLLNVEVEGCTVEQGEFVLQNTTGASVKLTRADNTGDVIRQCFNVNSTTDSVFDTITGVGGAWGLGLNSGGNTNPTVKNSSFIDNASRGIFEHAATVGLNIQGGTMQATEGVVASGWIGLHLNSDAIVAGMTILSTATTGFVVSARCFSTFTGKLIGINCFNPAAEESIFIESANTDVVNTTTSKAIGFTGVGALSAGSVNNNVI